MPLSHQETTGLDRRRHPLGGQVRHKHGTLAALSDDRNPQTSQKQAIRSRLNVSQTTTFRAHLCYGPRLVRTLPTRVAARLAAVLAGLAVIAAVPVALGADSATLRSHAAGLRAESSGVEARAHAAVLTLYALESELTQARADVAAVEARREALARERESTRRQLAAARTSMRVSEARLAELVRALYEQDRADPLAVMLGAASLDEALTDLDSLSRAAADNRRTLERTRAARGRLARLDARLARREGDLERVADTLRARVHAVETKAAERAAYVAGLRRQQGLTDRRIAALETQARAAERRTASTARAPAAAGAAFAPVSLPAASPAVAPAQLGNTLTVAAVGYSLPGRTASGLPVGHGIVAVDPSVIPLGTRIFVPGYGEAVAADTGSAVRGAMIDLWFPTTAAALQWGRRTVTITLR
jgi:cystine transport system substrate-binding protein